MLAEARFQLINQGGLHVAIFVGNVQTDDVLTVQGTREILLQSAAVLFLHDEDEVRPANVTLIDTDPGMRFSSSRLHRIPGYTLKHMFGGQTPDLILAANKQEFQWLAHAPGAEWTRPVNPEAM